MGDGGVGEPGPMLRLVPGALRGDEAGLRSGRRRTGGGQEAGGVTPEGEREIYALDLPPSLNGLIDLALRVDARLTRMERRGLFNTPSRGPADGRFSGGDVVSPTYDHEPMQLISADADCVTLLFTSTQRIPFSGQIQGGLQNGKSIILSGRVLPGANRFHVNFQCGSHSGANIALYFNPRYESTGYVVLNSFQNMNWGSEERKHESPFPQGQTFTLQILVEQDEYKISTNGRHFMDYRHRVPYSNVDIISVDGMVELNSIVFQNPAAYTAPQAAFQPQYAAPPGCGFPAYPAAPNYTIPYKTVINGGLHHGKNIVIHGVINPNANRSDIR
ncbi:galectin-9-like [Carassius auratus]|uniref:Galectin n=1 Tax=Carassius auratus TaxID=7957 RepID=A0A6P6QV33_CARAU|nr:galectin-9-like [Carassius auratus]